MIDYGASNTFSISSALERTGFNVLRTCEPEEITACDSIVIPGVGHFGHASRRLRPLRTVLQEAIDDGRPTLGICLGLQILFNSSEESCEPGLGLLSGRVVRVGQALKVPHMGWNQLSIRRPTGLLEGVPEGAYVYFVHSYHVIPDDESIVTAVTEYGQELVASVESTSIFGTQFHPEKSGEVGRRVLQNFYRMVVRQ